MGDLHERQDEMAEGNEQTKVKHGRLSGPLRVGLFFAALAVVLTLLGLWRANNLSLRNVLLGIALGGGTWGLVSWAIATAAAQVEEDVASRGDRDG